MEPDEQEFKALNPQEAMSIAVGHHRKGNFAEAEKRYHWILETMPDQPDAMHFLGVLLHQREGSDRAVALIKRSVARAPERVDWQNDLGNILFERGDLLEAAAAFRKSVAMAPSDAIVWNNLGAVLQRLQRYEEAASVYRKAIELNPDFTDALNNYGNLLSVRGRVIEAAEYFCKAFVLMPAHTQSKMERGIAFYRLGRIAEAAEVYRQWMLEEPGNPTAIHLYNACSGQNVPPRASDAYIETIFDEYAKDFDSKLEQLSYQGQKLIAEALARVAMPGQRLDCLDAGCGTGILGPLIAPYVSRLIGVDLSARMLSVARGRGFYNELVKAELTGYMFSHADTFGLIVASDTLNYFGALEEALAAASSALHAGGLLLFTVEKDDEEEAAIGYRLNPHGRYSHTRVYLSSALTASGFEALTIESGALRVEWGRPVECLVVTARKNA